MEIKAYAKINLDLYVGKKDIDNYHDIDSIFVKIDLYDLINIKIEKSNKKEISVRCKEVSQNNNLVYKIIDKYLDYNNIKAKITCSIKKNIPLKSGLGGGSSDAASVLLFLNNYFKKNTQKELIDLSYSLSSDMIFFLENVNSALVTNKGKKIEKIDIGYQEGYLLFDSFNKLSTKDAYSKIDNLRLNEPKRKKLFYLKDVSSWYLYNSFSNLYPFQEIKKEYEKKGYIVGLTGSGSCIFLLKTINSLPIKNSNLTKFKFLLS